ncbi:hypothetical protein SAMN05216233_11550 [Desulfoluna spongiiphila]|uniref:Uncharacterized protein n=1 Tax=Desulfoluna spongiiphila TaxID=419481 RepID=A0A1G5HPV0_9BACT|nr:hypothetical protein SAMN05216233_11550 [Desulfoluna spongiiphila]
MTMHADQFSTLRQTDPMKRSVQKNTMESHGHIRNIGDHSCNRLRKKLD